MTYPLTRSPVNCMKAAPRDAVTAISRRIMYALGPLKLRSPPPWPPRESLAYANTKGLRVPGSGAVRKP